MMDKVFLWVNGKKITRFKSYLVESDLYVADTAFQMELADPDSPVTRGAVCELYVNGTRELTGVIDKVNPSYEKDKRTLKITGRDLMGVLVDACCEDFGDLKNMKLSALAQKLIYKIPLMVKLGVRVEYREDVRGKLKTRGEKVGIFDTGSNALRIEPGMTVFETLKTYARSAGLIFYCLPDGTFVFDKPKSSGTALFSLTNRLSGRGNNVLSGEILDDISKRYSKVIVVGQRQGLDIFGTGDIKTLATVTDVDFPFSKVYVQHDEFGGDHPERQGAMMLEKMKHDGYRLIYKVQGHGQNGKNWTVNELCRIYDEDPLFHLDGSFLVTGRVFEKSKDRGTITTLRLENV